MTDSPVSSPPTPGDIAPAFALPDDTGTIQELASQHGHWLVLFFYPKDFTGGCTTEVCEFRDATADFSGLDATIWGVSVLDSASKAEFKAKNGLDYPLLADEDHAVAERYGVWVEKNNYGKVSMGIARTTFLIDPEGRIAHVWRQVKPEGHGAAVLEIVRASATNA
jgi:thioredoxin-dependent peroxiredoxin